MKKLFASIAFFLLVFSLLPVFAESAHAYSPLSDPYIPNGETSSYLVVNKKGSVKINETVNLDKTGNKYIIKVSAPSITRELTILRETMTPVELTIITNKDTYRLTTRKNVNYLNNNQKGASFTIGRLTLLSASDMPYSLRGYPFAKPVPVEIKFLNDQGTGDNDTPFKVTAEAAGEETLAIGGRQIPCYIIEIKYHVSGFMSLFKSMFPKTRLWYCKESPHYLVKYENKGDQGSASTGNMVMTITQYSGWK